MLGDQWHTLALDRKQWRKDRAHSIYKSGESLLGCNACARGFKGGAEPPHTAAAPQEKIDKADVHGISEDACANMYVHHGVAQEASQNV